MLESIVKDIVASVQENVQMGIKAVVDRFEPRLKALEDYRIETVEAQKAARERIEKQLLELAGPAQKEDHVLDFVKAFTEGMSDGA